MASKLYVVFVLALVLTHAKARDVPTKNEPTTEGEVAPIGHEETNTNTNTVNFRPTDKNRVPNGKGVKDKKCFFSGVGGWGGLGGIGGFIPLGNTAVHGGTGAAGVPGGLGGAPGVGISP